MHPDGGVDGGVCPRLAEPASACYRERADMQPEPVAVATLPPFSNQRGCPRCGARYAIRVHFDRDCAEVRGDHFHRLCRCGHEWLERCGEEPTAPVTPPAG